jgi:pimeloyl-ACP methyl ester carboxylesterase
MQSRRPSQATSLAKSLINAMSLETAMATYVLVHGAWYGAWCYRDVAKYLRAGGHDVFTPTHSGLGERQHQAGEAITLESHIRDVCGCIEAEELNDIILACHSYGGMVATGVADRHRELIRHLVYIDAYVPENGDSLISLLHEALEPDVAASFIKYFRSSAAKNNCGMMKPLQAELFNVVKTKRSWIDRRACPQALATFECPVLLSDTPNHLSKHYILADNWDPSPFRYFAKKVGSLPGWKLTKMPCGHNIMVDMPDELACILLDLA